MGTQASHWTDAQIFTFIKLHVKMAVFLPASKARQVNFTSSPPPPEFLPERDMSNNQLFIEKKKNPSVSMVTGDWSFS